MQFPQTKEKKPIRYVYFLYGTLGRARGGLRMRRFQFYGIAGRVAVCAVRYASGDVLVPIVAYVLDLCTA